MIRKIKKMLKLEKYNPKCEKDEDKCSVLYHIRKELKFFLVIWWHSLSGTFGKLCRFRISTINGVY